MRRPRGSPRRIEPRRPGLGSVRGADQGSAAVEFALVAVVLLLLLLGVLQVAVYLYVRNIAAASAAEGARYAANADVDPEQGAQRARVVLRRGAGRQVASRVECTGTEEAGVDGVRLSGVRCAGTLPVFFAPIGGVLPLHVAARSIEEDDG